MTKHFYIEELSLPINGHLTHVIVVKQAETKKPMLSCTLRPTIHSSVIKTTTCLIEDFHAEELVFCAGEKSADQLLFDHIEMIARKYRCETIAAKLNGMNDSAMSLFLHNGYGNPIEFADRVYVSIGLIHERGPCEQPTTASQGPASPTGYRVRQG